MGLKERNKGKRGELELSKKFAEVFGVIARRGQQYCGGGESPDVVGLPGVHVESKRTERLLLWPSVDQAVADAAEGNVPVVFHRPNGREWVAIVRLADMPNLVDSLKGLRGPGASPASLA